MMEEENGKNEIQSRKNPTATESTLEAVKITS